MPLLRRNDATLHYEISGNGPPVLLIQGIGVVGGCWRPQVKTLAEEHQTVIFDNRGIGKSLPCTGPITIEAMADDVLSLMDAVGWKSAHVVGHSMGGVIAQQTALQAPQRVRSLSLLCTFLRGKDGARLTPWVLWMTLRTRLGTRRMRRRAFLDMLWPPNSLQRVESDALAAKVGELVGRDLAESPPILMKQLRAMARHDASTRLRSLEGIPTFVLSGEHDPIALPRHGKMLADAIPGAKLEIMRQAAHGLTIQKADEVSELLRRFISSVEHQSRAVME